MKIVMLEPLAINNYTLEELSKELKKENVNL